MHSSRVVIRSPQVCRIVKAPSSVRPMSLFSAPQYVPRFVGGGTFPTFASDVAPLFRLIDDFATSTRALDNWPQFQARPAGPFQPRFDVRELNDSFELRGELPGVEGSALQVEFTDPQTLVIRGSIATEKTSGGRPAQEPTPIAAIAAEGSKFSATAEDLDSASTHSTSPYQKATVEDEEVAEGSSSASAQPTPTESTTTAPEQESLGATAKTSAPAQQPRYWISERSTGSFQRTFNFPSRINQEAVRASLKNGVLQINVPKASAPTTRRINVE